MRQAKLDFEIDYGYFFQKLVDLVNIKSCFWEEDAIKLAINYCSQNINLPPKWAKYVDSSGNLIVYNTEVNPNKPMLYLSSHVDVVGATESGWLTPPFQATETDEYILGRGVNDCKAGTAFQLLLAKIIADNTNDDFNLGFFFMFREEGNIGKTSSKIEFNKLPFSELVTYIITLENTIKLTSEGKYKLGVYDREPHNLFITCTGTLDQLRQSMDELCSSNWKPVVIEPVSDCFQEDNAVSIIHNPNSGHSASLKDNYVLKDLIKNSERTLTIRTGNINDASVVSPEIYVSNNEKEIRHNLVYNYRGFDTFEQIKDKLKSVNYSETFGFEKGMGSNQSTLLMSSGILSFLNDICDDDLSIELIDNPGRSDASAIFNALTPKQRQNIIPFASGIGCRTHIDKHGTRHATHGINEGFFKPSAYITIPAFLKLIFKFKN